MAGKPLTIFSYPKNVRVYKSLIAAAFGDIKIETPEFDFPKDCKTKEFLAKNPNGKVPLLETPEGPLYESNAIMRYVARLTGKEEQLFGKDAYTKAQVDQWIDWSANELDAIYGVWIYNIMGYLPYDEVAQKKCVADIKKRMQILNKHFQLRTYAVGERITLADIALVCSLYLLYTMVFEPKFRKSFSNVTRWFQTCVHQPEFAKVLGEVKLCEKMMPPNKTKVVKSAAAEEKPKDTKPKGKPKNPLDALPPSKFDLEEFKRVYSNEDTRKVALPWFWEHFDPEGYCIYLCNFKYNDEQKKKFMASNLVGGWFQRVDRLRKYAFSCMLIFGEEPDLAISGMWMFRGNEIPPQMKECDDTELYDWVKVDINNAQQKALVEDMFAWEGKFEGVGIPENVNHNFNGSSGKLFK